MDAEEAALQAELTQLDTQLNAAPSAMFTPAPAAPAPTQLQSLIDQPTRALTDVELGVAQLRAMSPLEQTAAELEGRKLLFGEGYSFGILPKLEAAGTSLKEALYGTPITEAFGQAVSNQDILKEYVRQKDLEQGNLTFGISGPELAGGLLSPIGRLYTPTQIARSAPLGRALATRTYNVGKATATSAGAAGLQTFLSTPGTLEERLTAAGESAQTGAMLAGGLGTLGQIASATAPKVAKLGGSLQRMAMGLRKSDLTSVQNAIRNTEDVFELPELNAGKVSQSQLTTSFNNLIKNNVLGESSDATVLFDNAKAARNDLEDQIQTALQKVDQSDTKVTMPTFSNAQKYIDENRVPLGQEDAYKNIISTFKEKVKNESQFVAPEIPTLYDEFGNPLPVAESPTMQKAIGAWEQEQIKRSRLSLDVLNKQKKIFSEQYREGPQSDAGFW